MSLTAPISGKDGHVTYGTGTPKTVAMTKWTAKPTSNSIDVSNSADGRRRIAGLGDAEGTFECHVDTSATYETDLAPGTIVTANFFVDLTKKYGPVQVIIDSVDYGVEVEGSYDATFNWKLASGTFPAAPV